MATGAPLTEGAVRAAFEELEASAPNDTIDRRIREVAEAAFHVIAYRHVESADWGAEEIGAHVLRDLRPTEAARLHEIIEGNRDILESDIRRMCVEAAADAALEFAAEFPDAPRAVQRAGAI